MISVAGLSRRPGRGLSLAGRVVGPVAHLVAIDPSGHVIARHDQGLGEPLEIVGHDPAGVLAAIKSAGAAVDRLGAVAGLEAVLDLAFVALPELTRNAAKEDARVQVLAVRENFELQHEIAVLAVATPTGRCRS